MRLDRRRFLGARPGTAGRCRHPALYLVSVLDYTRGGWSADRASAVGSLENRHQLPSLDLSADRAMPSAPFLLDPERILRVVIPWARSSAVGKKLYVGNLTYNVNESDLEALFTPFGTVQSA